MLYSQPRLVGDRIIARKKYEISGSPLTPGKGLAWWIPASPDENKTLPR